MHFNKNVIQWQFGAGMMSINLEELGSENILLKRFEDWGRMNLLLLFCGVISVIFGGSSVFYVFYVSGATSEL